MCDSIFPRTWHPVSWNLPIVVLFLVVVVLPPTVNSNPVPIYLAVMSSGVKRNNESSRQSGSFLIGQCNYGSEGGFTYSLLSLRFRFCSKENSVNLVTVQDEIMGHFDTLIDFIPPAFSHSDAFSAKETTHIGNAHTTLVIVCLSVTSSH
jgi:hypothetical protein